MRVLLNVPKQVKRGEPIEVKVLISHPMENGQRRDESGQVVPRQIINAFRASYNGVEVLRLALHPAIAANPFLSFAARAVASGPIELSWEDDAGVKQTETAMVEVV
ncbi:MAG: thiosulfate oxidation carrier complex protein SoxZ [Janthinobacterium lividum]